MLFKMLRPLKGAACKTKANDKICLEEHGVKEGKAEYDVLS